MTDLLSDARAFKAQLLNEAHDLKKKDSSSIGADAALAALAQPEQPAEGEVTDDEIRDQFYHYSFEDFGQRLMTFQEFHAAARAAIALDRSRRAAPVPVPVSERLPRPEDCDADGMCWLCGKVEGDWRLLNPENTGVPQLKYCFTHWLPAHALPLPAGEVQP